MSLENTSLAVPTVARAIELVWKEAELLDRKEYAEWLRLWNAEGIYVIPIDPATSDFYATLNYALDDHEMRKKRVERLMSTSSPSVSNAAKTIRTVSRFNVVRDSDGIVDLRSAQIVVAYRQGNASLFAAEVEHRIDVSTQDARLVQKIVRLVDSLDSLAAISFLL
ncbi:MULTISPECIES: aromatic-ring-hydroxylating dioxygenase subunit beta [Pandoraea]|uniref:Phenylpropionate dioxygenase n=1 Tax=Pandoraea communis TaxID=2508297 RepID=A0A5E4XVG7_9BURK|nr:MULTISPECIES: aromatic-ring-hydroxylating dioxygenase subunit beta [Pandoraea]ALS66630.1 hypothetical protein AT395_18035 [Pandoraea apista]CFB61388.1 3-phenylpropionate dioxygenase subunit beta [Pandoraea apista]VVE40092.1 phenylpropionate dioxygenase [Pandoraea communis]